MNTFQYTAQSMRFSTYIALKGNFESTSVSEFSKSIVKYIESNKDLYLDIKEIDSLDILGLNALITAKCLVNAQGGEFFIFTNKNHDIYRLMNQIKLKDQLNFRDTIIQDSFLEIAS